MAVLTAYAYKLFEWRTDNLRAMGDLLGGGRGPSLAGVLRQILTDGSELPAAPGDDEPPREVYWTVDSEVSSTVEGEEYDWVVWGRVVQTKDEPALTKTRRATGNTYDFEDGDPGERPLFFLVSAPPQAQQALLIAERAGSYTQTVFWRRHVKREIQSLVTRPLKSDPSRHGPAVTVELARFADLTPGEYYEQYADAVLEARATSYIEDGGAQAEVRLKRKQQPDKGWLRRLMDHGSKAELADALLGGFVAVPKPPDEFQVVADVGGRPQVITVDRDRIGYLGKKIPADAPLDGRFVDPNYLLELARDWASQLGHQSDWHD